MKSITLPGTDLRVSGISLGTVPFGTSLPRDAAFDMLDAYVGAGGNFIDTAHVYANWFGGEPNMSEKTIGQWLRKRGRRDDLVIATKGGHPDMSKPLGPRLAAEQIVSDLNESLSCLGVDQIDVYYLHRDDPARPAGDIIETLNAQQRAGKLRYFACSNWQPARVRVANDYAVAHGLHGFAVRQIFWSLAVANPSAFPSDHALMNDDGAMDFYSQANMAVVAFTAQARGFFSKAAANGLGSLAPERRREFESAENVARLARAKEVAAQLGTSVTAVVLAYIQSHAFVGVPIIGPRSLDQLRDSLADADLTLSPETVRYLATGV